jgi:hypothetical protein
MLASHLHQETTINSDAFISFSSVSLLLFKHVLVIFNKVFKLNSFVFILFIRSEISLGNMNRGFKEQVLKYKIGESGVLTQDCC